MSFVVFFWLFYVILGVLICFVKFSISLVFLVCFLVWVVMTSMLGVVRGLCDFAMFWYFVGFLKIGSFVLRAMMLAGSLALVLCFEVAKLLVVCCFSEFAYFGVGIRRVLRLGVVFVCMFGCFTDLRFCVLSWFSV